MISWPVHRGLVAAFVTGFLSIASTSSAQDEAFKKAFEARNNKRWPDVVPGMLAAIKADSKESSRQIRVGGFAGLGGRETEYLPYFYLGEAHFNGKNCAGAIVAWETSEQQGVVRTRTDLLTIMQEGYRACAAQGFLLAADFKTVSSSSRQAYENANKAAGYVYALMEKRPELVRPEDRDAYGRAQGELTNARDRLGRAQESRLRSDFEDAQAAALRAADTLRPVEVAITNAFATSARIEQNARQVAQVIQSAEAVDRSIDELKTALPQDLIASRAQARERLALARERATAGERSQNPGVLEEAFKHAQFASAALTDLLDRGRRLVLAGFEQKLGAAIKGVEERFSFIDASMASLERLAADRPTLVRPDLAERREAIRKDVDAQRRRFDRARASEDLVSIERIRRSAEEARAALDELLKSFGPITLRDRGIDQALEDGARLFFQGDYRNALAALNPPGGLPDIPLQQHVHLLRAAASYALWVRSGGTDKTLEAAALKEIETSKRLNSSFRPDPRRFSPAFISFYEQAGATPQAAPGSPAR